MPDPTVAYRSRPDLDQAELNALANVYRFILDCHAKKEGGPAQSRPESDAKESENGCTAIPKHIRT